MITVQFFYKTEPCINGRFEFDRDEDGVPYTEQAVITKVQSLIFNNRFDIENWDFWRIESNNE